MTTHRGKHPSCIPVGTGCIEVLDIDRAEMYLGRSVCLGDYHQSELRNRIKCGWAAFSKYKDIFSSRSYSFPLKAKLFNSIVTPVILYSTASWTLTQKMEKILNTAMRQMLRKMLCAGRRPDEDWVDYIKRTTADAEKRMYDLGYEAWTISHKKKKLRFIDK